MRQMRRFLTHYFNPLHVYCRLCDFGLAPGRARRVCGAYERLFFRR